MDTKTQVDFKGFYRSLDHATKERFAERADTSTAYIEVHLVYGRRIPRPKRMEKLYEACAEFGASFSRAELIDFFYASESAAESVSA